ncbi:hypothetical protein EDD15DRAFT_2362668 [Pisolithus albus]|nr:hypothetical protein EDD15DRAFT_2362668 [Pisolithus albus]
MSVQKSPELQKSVEHILQIFDRCVVSTMNLMEAERLKCWKEAVKAITGELDSMRLIINMTDSIPHLLIGVDKFLHWSERIGSPTHPFPDWKNALFPTADLIAGHPWLLAVDRRSNNDRRDLSLHHGKQKEGDGEVPVTADHPIIPTLDDEGESEVHEVDELVDDNDDEVKPARGWSKKRARSQSTTRRSDTWGRSRSCMHTADVEEERDDRIAFIMKHPPAVVIPTPKRMASYTILPARRAEASGSTPVRAVSAEHQSRPMPLSAPTPEWLPPTATPSVPELLMRVDAMTDRQDLILARINDLERWILTLDTRTPAPTPGLADDRIHMLESEFAEFQWTVATLTREIEALQLKVEGAIPPNPAASTSMPTIPMEPEVAVIERTEEVTAASFPPPLPDDVRTPPLHSSPSPTATTVTAAQAIQTAAIPSPDAVTAADVEPVAQSEGETVNATIGDPATEMDVCPL